MICNNCCGNCGNFQPLCSCHGAFVPKQPSETQSLLVCNGVWQRRQTTASKVAFFARVVRSQTFLLLQARINCKIVNNFANFSIVCKIKRATAHCTCKMNLTVSSQLTALKQKCTKPLLGACFFHCPKACAKVQCSHCQIAQKLLVGFVLLKLQRANAKK